MSESTAADAADAAPRPTSPLPPPASGAPPTEAPQPTESPADAGARKPRDARILHLILASMGVGAYEERVPLMLLDFAYRYTSAVLQDALLFSDSINSTANTGGQNPPASIATNDLRMSIASRVNHQFNPGLPKEFLLEVAQDRNRVALPTVGPEFGVRLPPEKYCLTGINWDLEEGMEEWAEVSDDEDEDVDMPVMGSGVMLSTAKEENDEDKMDVDDLFGGGSGDGDTTMADA
ncbi:TFIID-31kDa-domain-containing protein [Ascodesmis nigricans]|uniref:TFIID-31kDa-domain-containing protein n=1 Tax=Ascodesmis nigricans TaxID=341454 RepID=A0A4S2N7H3_9PEZI|nr:TFIID-31kDa-domain-containing protein [Ascodesmis nigricans]